MTSTTASPTARCARCRTVDEGSEAFVVAGLTFCRACHDDLTAAVRTHLEPEAARTRRTVDYFVSAVVVVPDGEGWVVHLHTLQPGLVIGREGGTAAKIRQSLIEVKGDDQLRLNVVPHEVFGCDRSIAAAQA